MERHEQRDRLVRRRPRRRAAGPACPRRSRPRRMPSARSRPLSRRQRCGRRVALRTARTGRESRRAARPCARSRAPSCKAPRIRRGRLRSAAGPRRRRRASSLGLPLHHDAGRLHVEAERRVERQRAHVEAVLEQADAGRVFAAVDHGVHQPAADARVLALRVDRDRADARGSGRARRGSSSRRSSRRSRRPLPRPRDVGSTCSSVTAAASIAGSRAGSGGGRECPPNASKTMRASSSASDA